MSYVLIVLSIGMVAMSFVIVVQKSIAKKILTKVENHENLIKDMEQRMDDFNDILETAFSDKVSRSRSRRLDS